MKIEIEVEEVIWGVEEIVYYGTHSSNTKSRQKDKNGGKYIKLFYRRRRVLSMKCSNG